MCAKDKIIWSNAFERISTLAEQIQFDDSVPEASYQSYFDEATAYNQELFDDLKIDLKDIVFLNGSLVFGTTTRDGVTCKVTPFDAGTNMSGVLSSHIFSNKGTIVLYLDGDTGDLKVDCAHDYGSDRYTIRAFKDDLDPAEINEFMSKAFFIHPSDKEIDKMTVSIGPDIAKNLGITSEEECISI